MSYRVLETPISLGIPLRELDMEHCRQAYFKEEDGAIPVFVGYTEHINNVKKDVENVRAVEVHSLLDFEKRFGTGPQIDIQSIHLKNHRLLEVDSVELEEQSVYFLYESLKLYFRNGGEKCFVVSIGSYDQGTSVKHFKSGIECAAGIQDATFLCVPDASILAKMGRSDDFLEIQSYCLRIANRLKDRIVLLDWHPYSQSLPSQNFLMTTDKGCNSTKSSSTKSSFLPDGGSSFGAAYYPWVVASGSKEIRYEDIHKKIKCQGRVIPLSRYLPESRSRKICRELSGILGEKEALCRRLELVKKGELSWCAHFSVLVSQYNRVASLKCIDQAEKQEAYSSICQYLIESIHQLFHSWLTAPLMKTSNHSNVHWLKRKECTKSSIVHMMDQDLRDELNELLLRLIRFTKGLEAHFGKGVKPETWGWVTEATTIQNFWCVKEILSCKPLEFSYFVDANHTGRKSQSLKKLSVSELVDIFNKFNLLLCFMFRKLDSSINELDNELKKTSTVYRQIILKASEHYHTVPPCGVVAGAYRLFDRQHGIWKSPSNLCIRGVVDVSETAFFQNNSLLKESSFLNDFEGGEGFNFNRLRPISSGAKLSVLNKDGSKFLSNNHQDEKTVILWGSSMLSHLSKNEPRFISAQRLIISVQRWLNKRRNDPLFFQSVRSMFVMVKSYLRSLWHLGALQGQTEQQAYFVEVNKKNGEVSDGSKVSLTIGMAVMKAGYFNQFSVDYQS